MLFTVHNVCVVSDIHLILHVLLIFLHPISSCHRIVAECQISRISQRLPIHCRNRIQDLLNLLGQQCSKSKCLHMHCFQAIKIAPSTLSFLQENSELVANCLCLGRG